MPIVGFFALSISQPLAPTSPPGAPNIHQTGFLCPATRGFSIRLLSLCDMASHTYQALSLCTIGYASVLI